MYLLEAFPEIHALHQHSAAKLINRLLSRHKSACKDIFVESNSTKKTLLLVKVKESHKILGENCMLGSPQNHVKRRLIIWTKQEFWDVGNRVYPTMLFWAPNVPCVTILYGRFVKPQKPGGGSSQPLLSWGKFGDFTIIHWPVPIQGRDDELLPFTRTAERMHNLLLMSFVKPTEVLLTPRRWSCPLSFLGFVFS